MEKGFTLWFTGPSGSGKTTLANEVEGILLERGLKVEVLNGDDTRVYLARELGFSPEDCDAHVRRVGYVCNLLARNGVAAIAALIAPGRAAREENRRELGRYVEVYCKCPVEVLAQRDTKGLYKKSASGEVQNLAGTSSPYEEPEKPEVVVETDKESVEDGAMRVIRTLEVLGYVPKVEGDDYSSDEEAQIRDRLSALGYI
jgi:adenylylsulfate kinase